MKYLCLGFCSREKMDARPKAEIDAIMRECMPHVEDLYKTGHLIIDAGLNWDTTSVRSVNGKVTVMCRPVLNWIS